MKLKDLSENLGLSQTTVSRALNGYPEVSETTRDRVLKFAQQHNYRPNTRASSLATGKAMAIGHIVPFHSNIEVFNPIFAEFIAGSMTRGLNCLINWNFRLSFTGAIQKTPQTIRG